jgi:hypothetical protein
MLGHGARPAAKSKRKQTVGPLLGDKVRTEWRLLTTTDNLGKLHRRQLAAAAT